MDSTESDPDTLQLKDEQNTKWVNLWQATSKKKKTNPETSFQISTFEAIKPNQKTKPTQRG